jgi:hypothetical protein
VLSLLQVSVVVRAGCLGEAPNRRLYRMRNGMQHSNSAINPALFDFDKHPA